jgi:hypothetical protein
MRFYSAAQHSVNEMMKRALDHDSTLVPFVEPDASDEEKSSTPCSFLCLATLNAHTALSEA